MLLMIIYSFPLEFAFLNIRKDHTIVKDIVHVYPSS